MLIFIKKSFILSFFVLTISYLYCQELDETNNHKVCFFINTVECPGCAYSNLQDNINYFFNKNINTYLIVKNIRLQQIKKVNKYLKTKFSNCSFLYDTNSYYTNKYNPNNNEIIITDKYFNLIKKIENINNYNLDSIHNKIFKNISTKIIDFKNDYPVQYYDIEFNSESSILYINDRIQKAIYFINENTGKIIKNISYKKKLNMINKYTDDYTCNIIKNKNLNKSRSIGFVNNGNNIELMMYIMDKITTDGNGLKQVYSYYKYDYENNNITKILTPDKYYFQTNNFLYFNNYLYAGVYDTKYYHLNHNKIKDNSGAFARYKADSIEILYNINLFENFTESLYTYSFVPEIEFSGLKNIVIYNPLNSLLISFDPLNPKSITNYKVEGKLKVIFDSMKEYDKLKLYNHKQFINPVDIHSTSFKCYNGNTYILLMERKNKSIFIYLQIYNVNGSLIGEYKLDLKKDNDNLISINLFNVNINSIKVLSEWENDFLEINTIYYNLSR